MVDHLTHWALGFDAPTSQYFYLGMCSFHRLVGRSHANRRYVLSVLLLLNFLYSLLLFFVGYTHNQWRAIAHEKKVPEKVFSSPTIRELQLAHIFRDLASKLNHLKKKVRNVCLTHIAYLAKLPCNATYRVFQQRWKIIMKFSNLHQKRIWIFFVKLKYKLSRTFSYFLIIFFTKFMSKTC